MVGEFEFYNNHFRLNGDRCYYGNLNRLSIVMRWIISIKFDGKTLYLLTRKGSDIFRMVYREAQGKGTH